MSYCIDTSSLIEAWQRAYPIDCFPTFWKRLDELVGARRIVSPDEVKVELQKQAKGGVWEWAKAHSESLFVPIDVPLQQSLSEVLARFEAMMKRKTGRHAADPWVVALARITGAVVVTEESVLASDANPSIPHVCRAFDVTAINLCDLVRRERWSF